MSGFVLDRRFISGPVDMDMPNCVLVDIAMGNRWINPEKYNHNLLMQNLLEGTECLYTIPDLSEKDILEAGKETLAPHASKIASYINPDKSVVWSVNALITAFKHMLRVGLIDNIKVEIPENMIIGLKNAENPLAFNASMLYRICKKHGVSTRPSMTIEQLGNAVAMIRDILSFKIIIPNSAPFARVTKGNYINFLLESETKAQYIPEYNPETMANFETLCVYYDNISDVNKTIPRLEPSSHQEAVIVAALKHGIDISSSTVPLLELEELDNCNDYEPRDYNFRRRYRRNPLWFSPKKNYSSTLAMIYNNDSLISFLRGEAFPQEEVDLIGIESNSREKREMLKNSLYQARISYTFYYGWHPDSSNTKTPIELEDLTDEKADVKTTITYGSVECGDLTVYKTSELCGHFLSSKSFTNPTRITENFPSIAMRKLKLICENIVGLSFRSSSMRNSTSRTKNTSKLFTEEEKGAFSELLRAIEVVDRSMIELSEKAENLRTIYENTEVKGGKKSIEEALTKLLHAGFYMRGWKVSCLEDVLPLNVKDTQFVALKQGEVDLNTSKALQTFKNHLSAMDKMLSLKIKNLPLIKYQTGTASTVKPTFRQSTDADDGLTVWERCAIVIEGEKSDNSSACIRLSSNWLVSSAYYYMLAIGMSPGFDIADLSMIS
jgi:hypothetical protein